MFEVARMHPEYAQQLGELQGTIDQNPQMMHPAHHLSIAAEVMWDPRIHRYQKTNLMHGLGYALRFMESPEYEGYMRQKLNLDNPSNFAKTAHFLELMQNMYNMGDEYSYGDDNIVVSRIRNVVSDVVESRRGSYLLNVRARQLLEVMDGRDYIWSDNDHVPFEITPGRFAYPHQDGIYMAEASETPRVEESIKNLQKADDAIREVMKTGQTTFSRSDPLMRARDTAYRSFGTLTPHKIGREDVALPTDGTAAEEELHDYAYMLSRPIRGIVKEDFGADITHLSLREQFRFLNYLKSVDLKNAQNVQQFTKSFGDDGLRTFLVTANDSALRDEVFEFAQSVPKEQAEGVFAAYGKLVSGIDGIGEYLREAFGREGADVEQQVVERLLTRARGVLAKSHEYKDEPEKLKALVDSVQAENVMFLESFKAIKSEGALKLEDVAAVRSNIISGQELLAEQNLLTAVEQIYAKNYDPEATKLLLDRFRTDLSQPGAQFFLISHQFEGRDIPIAFMLTLQQGERVHVSALNVEQEFSGARPGRVLIDKVSEMARAGKIVEAEAVPDVARAYISQWGCVGTGVERDADGAIVFNVELDARRSSALRSRDKAVYPVPRLAGMAADTFVPREDMQVIRCQTDEELLAKLAKPLASGYVLTQLMPRDGATLAVIERQRPTAVLPLAA